MKQSSFLYVIFPISFFIGILTMIAFQSVIAGILFFGFLVIVLGKNFG